MQNENKNNKGAGVLFGNLEDLKITKNIGKDKKITGAKAPTIKIERVVEKKPKAEKVIKTETIVKIVVREKPQTTQKATTAIQDRFKYMDIIGLEKLNILLKFIEWTSLPKEYRDPKTKTEFAKKHGVARKTITSWQRRLGFFDEVDALGEMWRQKTPEVYQGLLAACKKGNPLAIKLWLMKFEKFTDQLEIGAKVPSAVTPEQAEQVRKAFKHIGLESILAKNNENNGDDKD